MIYKEKSDYATFVFKLLPGSEKYGFLQQFITKGEISSSVYFDWLRSKWGDGKNEAPTFCIASDFTHKIALKESHSAVLLKGNQPVDTEEVIAQLNRMYEYLSSGQMDNYFDGLEEKERYRDWFLNQSSELERKQFIDYTIIKKPVFVFNLDPVFVVYTKRPSFSIDLFDVLCFVRDSEGKLKLKGPSMGSTFENIFQSKEMRKAAEEPMSFKSLEISR